MGRRSAHVLALKEEVERLVRALKLDLAEAYVLAVIDKTIEFVEQVFGTTYTNEEWQQLAARRELFRVLGPLCGERIAAAYAAEDLREEERLSLLIVRELTTPRPGLGRCSDERLRLDPSCWNLVDCGDGPSVYLHLSQLCELVRLQNEQAVAASRAGRAKRECGLLWPEERTALKNTLQLALAEEPVREPSARPRARTGGLWSSLTRWLRKLAGHQPREA